MATAAEPRPAELPLAGGRPGTSVRLTPLLTATAISPPGWIHADDGRLARLRAIGVGVARDEWLTIPIPAFLVQHPGAGAVLIDTGFHQSVAVDPKENLGRLGALMFRGIEMDPSQALPAQLRERGIEPGDVGTVIMTHFHADHASGMSEFPNATFLFSAEEWQSATGPRPWERGYRARQFDHAFDYRTVDFDAPETSSYSTFGRSFDVFGDGSVRVVSTPGHTHGHLSVVLRLRDREALIAGDAIYTERTLREGAMPARVQDGHRFRRSLREIQLYAEQHPDALIVPGHDMDAWRRLEPAY